MTKIHDKSTLTGVSISLFREKGFHGTSVRLIAKKVGVSISTIYTHFDSKQDILSHICFGVGKKFLDSIDKLEKTAISPQEQLRSFIKNHVFIISQHAESIDVYTKEWKYMKDTKIVAFKNQMKKYKTSLAGIIDEGIRSDVFVNLNVGLVTNFILSAINNFEQLKSCPPSSITTIASDISTTIVRGVTKNNASRYETNSTKIRSKPSLRTYT